jgi:hypothetical protein
MKPEQQLELQAYLDGELSGHAAQRVADWMTKDPEAQVLAAELRMTHAALAGSGLELAVPESREFYWSKIRRAIEASEPAERESQAGWNWLFALRKHVVPLSSLTLAGLLALGFLFFRTDSSTYLAEVENLSDYVSSHSFRSRSENVFVVWISSQDPSQDEPTEVVDDGDVIIQ